MDLHDLEDEIMDLFLRYTEDFNSDVVSKKLMDILKAKQLALCGVSQQRELFDAILDFTEDLPMCSEDYNRDTLYKKYIAENCG